ncbi:MAG: lactonase family protein [Candidatus Lambdaproteobacteria bacterium]|nr:lactonase family protein [Candidatus Lambdaproteobacteria bacterium]
MSSGTSGSGREQMLYVSCARSKHIAILRRSASGALREVERIAVAGDNSSSPTSFPIGFSRERRFLYAALRGAPFPAYSYAIDAGSGALTLQGRVELPERAADLTPEPSGRYLLVASYQGNLVAAIPLDQGRVGAPAAAILPGLSKAHSVRFDPAGRFAYVGAVGDDQIVQLRFDPERPALTLVGRFRAQAGAGPRHTVTDREGRRLYVVNEQNGSVGAYAIDPATGALAELHTLPMVPPDPVNRPMAADIHLTPDGRYLYASVRRESLIAAFAIDPGSGRPTLVQTVETEPIPRGFVISADGTQLIAAGQLSDKLAVFSIAAGSGRLTRSGTVPVAGGPSWIEFL